MRRGFRFFVTVGAVSILAVYLMHLYVSFLLPPPQEGFPKKVSIPYGSGLLEISKILEKEGIIRHYKDFITLADFKGAQGKIMPGIYVFNEPLSQFEALARLLKGRAELPMITVPEGYNIFEIADLLEKNGILKKDEFITTATDRDFLKELGIEAETAEGFLFPDTYNFTRGMTPKEILSIMYQRFRKVYTPEMEENARKKGFTTMELITLSSIVEKETGHPAERELVASVFINRLRKNMRLDSDPTVIYGKWGGFDGNIRKKDLLERNDYNTYRIKGLPKGPISNPGKASIMAVLNAPDSRYLYFVSKNDGTHQFSATIAEHERAVRKYQKGFEKARRG